MPHQLTAVTWGMSATRLLLGTKSPFGAYFSSLMSIAIKGSTLGPSPRSPTWPCPLPFPEAFGSCPGAGRRRRRACWVDARRRLLNLIVAGLNFAAGEYRPWIPPSLRVWRPLSDEQWRHIHWLEVLVGRWGRTQVQNLEIGRKGEEIASYVRLLSAHAKTMHLDLTSYSSETRKVAGTPHRGFLPVVAERLAFPSFLEGCPLAELLGPYTCGLYEEPKILRAGPPRRHTASRPVFRGSPASLLPMFERWAKVGRFTTVEADGVARGDVTQVAAVAKPALEDRQLLDERGHNSVEDRLREGASKHLPSGALLLDVHLKPSERLALAAVDRKHFYHQFIASASRGRRTPVGAPLKGAVLQHLPGCRHLKADRLYYGCFQGLGMGDHAAVDFALEAHENALEFEGLLNE